MTIAMNAHSSRRFTRYATVPRMTRSSPTFVWRNDRYAPTSRGGEGFGDITIHRFEGPDLIVQSIRPGLPAEYAIARKFADGTYLVVPIDETDADKSTRKEFCSRESGASCRVATSVQSSLLPVPPAPSHTLRAASPCSWRTSLTA